MSMKLLPASVNPADPSPDASTSLVHLTPRARTGEMSLVPSARAFGRASSPRRAESHRISGSPVEDSQSDGTSSSVYISAWSWSRPVENTAAAQYLSYAADLVGWSGRLIDLYA